LNPFGGAATPRFVEPESAGAEAENMKTGLRAVAILLLATATPAARQGAPPIRNFVRVNGEFCTGAQPRLEHLEKLKAEGVKAVINLRPPVEHRAAEEEAKAKELGLRYFNIPVVFGEPKDEQATEFLKITDDPENRPAFIHCAAAVRVGAFWMIRRVLRDGWTIERAEAEAEKIGLRESPHLNEFARRYIEKHKTKEATAKP
jgi:protein tyrosine phosphatase (PTP) superfamily phosphohydrolase (DUF442 family)